jgi:hypothetical protein
MESSVDYWFDDWFDRPGGVRQGCGVPLLFQTGFCGGAGLGPDATLTLPQ